MTKSKVYLLDSNVLIALATPEHSLNARSAAWFLKGHRFAPCPSRRARFFRFHLRAGVEATPESAKLLLESISALPRHEFWPENISYLDMPTTGIVGHRQVTDAYLVLLARKHGGSVATLDRALAAVQAGNHTPRVAAGCSANRHGASGSRMRLNTLEGRVGACP